MENTTKKTKTTYFEELRELVMNSVSNPEMQDEYLAFIDKELAALDKRREVAKARAEKRKAESDALTDRIFDVLHYDYITVDVPVAVGDQFFAWIFGMRNKITIVGPEAVNKQMQEILQEVGRHY